MATLSADDIKAIRDIQAKGTVHHGTHFGQGDLQTACWNWALTGIVDQTNMVKPEVFCDYVSRDSLNAELHRQRCEQLGPYHTDARNAELNGVETAWFGNAANLLAIDAVKNAWNQSSKNAAAIMAASKGIARLSIGANGLTVVDHATDYRICVYYYDHVTQPNFQHWWIEVAGVWFELFPGLHDIQIMRDAQHLGGNKKDFFLHVVDLHQSQVTRIQQALAGYDGGWWHDDSTKVCTTCSVKFSLTTRKHHCRRCGKIFCSGCSSHTKIIGRVISRPESPVAEQGRVRVCDACFANP
ncbi:MAG: FYVE zinc finger domain-containing protein [Burkholderiaceae bacterium]